MPKSPDPEEFLSAFAGLLRGQRAHAREALLAEFWQAVKKARKALTWPPLPLPFAGTWEPVRRPHSASGGLLDDLLPHLRHVFRLLLGERRKLKGLSLVRLLLSETRFTGTLYRPKHLGSVECTFVQWASVQRPVGRYEPL